MISANLQLDELSPLCKGGRGDLTLSAKPNPPESPFAKGDFES